MTREPRGEGRRRLLILPTVFGLIIFLGIVVIGWSHLFAKGPAPQLHDTPQQVATGQSTPERGPYTWNDYVEPNSK